MPQRDKGAVMYSEEAIEGPVTVKLARFVPGGPTPFKTIGTFDTYQAATVAGDAALVAITDDPTTAGYLLFDANGREVGNWTYQDVAISQKKLSQ